MANNTHYNYIIAGTGCAGLSLVMRMVKHPFFADKKILLIEKDDKNTNDRTWCFWEKESNFFEVCVSKKWDTLIFKSSNTHVESNIAPYNYKLIRSKDLYKYCFDELKKYTNVDIINGLITAIDTQATTATVNNITYSADKIFSSILLQDPQLLTKDIYLLQHFKGYFIETPNPSFNENIGTIMDFNVSQEHGGTFFYTLPFTPHAAIVEYTLFTESLLEPEQYKNALTDYIKNVLKISEYKITEEEFGIIPMTNYKFNTQQNNTFYIGTTGGATKASSGYTFTFVQKQCELIVDALVNNTALKPVHTPRYQWFDTILLHVLHHRLVPLDKVFSRLFAKNSLQQVFKFLDEDASIFENIKLCGSLQILPFCKAVMQRIFK